MNFRIQMFDSARSRPDIPVADRTIDIGDGTTYSFDFAHVVSVNAQYPTRFRVEVSAQGVEWRSIPVYVTDNDVVMCYADHECEERSTPGWLPGRRVTLGAVVDAFVRHGRECDARVATDGE